ncbi:MAG: SDR family NAD(P)-dependent oxidoreductase [Alphaproteobacteria bacterium]
MSQRPLMVVVGGAGKIGAATIEAAQSRGFDTLSIDLRPSTAAKTFRIADICDEAAIATAFSSIDRPIDALVCVAVQSTQRSLQDTTWTEWAQMMAVNVRGPMLCLKHAAPRLRPATGSITLLSAAAAQEGPVAFQTSMGGVLGLMRATSGEFSRPSIRVNAVCPEWNDNAPKAAPSAIAEAILFLSSSDATFITGAEIKIT